jgi:tRNA (Thr-GGU) A37 N-methylase
VTVQGRVIQIADVDIVDGTPLLDLKPYVPEFDVRKTKRIGWLAKILNSLNSNNNRQRKQQEITRTHTQNIGDR